MQADNDNLTKYMMIIINTQALMLGII